MTASPTHVAPQADHADKARTFLQKVADLRAWLFLAFLILGFEIWSRIAFGGTFLFNPSPTAHREAETAKAHRG